MNNPHIGSDFDDFLRSEGIFDEVSDLARRKLATLRLNHEDCRAREFELKQQITELRNRVTYLQEELADTEDKLKAANQRLADFE